MKKVLIVLAVIVVVIGGLFVVAWNDIVAFDKMVYSYELKEITPDMVPDGTYTGKVESMMMAVELEVTVKDKRFADIKLLSIKSGPGHGATNMVDRLLAAQSITKVDAVSGASASSKAYQIALYKALSPAVIATNQ